MTPLPNSKQRTNLPQPKLPNKLTREGLIHAGRVAYRLLMRSDYRSVAYREAVLLIYMVELCLGEHLEIPPAARNAFPASRFKSELSGARVHATSR